MDSSSARARMVDRQLAGRGIGDLRVLEAFRDVPREAFLPPAMAEFAYHDAPLPIGDGQTISQPYIVAVTVEALALTGQERVLEIGTGCGRVRGPSLTGSYWMRLRLSSRRAGGPSSSPTVSCASGGMESRPTLVASARQSRCCAG